MKKTHLLWLLLISVISCNKDCQPAELSFAFVGFNLNEVDTVVIRRFVNDIGAPTDTAAYSVPDLAYTAKGDTLLIGRINQVFPLVSGFHYELWLPEPGILFNITPGEEDDRKDNNGIFNCNKDQCINRIKTVYVNMVPEELTDWNQLYLKK